MATILSVGVLLGMAACGISLLWNRLVRWADISLDFPAQGQDRKLP
jgi:hypothetical protein